MLMSEFFNRDACLVAKELLGKVIQHYCQNTWLCAQIIETEAYYLHDKASHASLGYTEKRKALFMQPGTIYMYYARGGDSFNISCQGEGNAVLIKSAIPYLPNQIESSAMISIMLRNNPKKDGTQRLVNQLCSGQTLLCKSLGLKVPEWNQQTFDIQRIFISDIGYTPAEIVVATRLGISSTRDAHLPYRFIDKKYLCYCSKKPSNI
jgi:DNA-3-methyladenine glycosylase